MLMIFCIFVFVFYVFVLHVCIRPLCDFLCSPRSSLFRWTGGQLLSPNNYKMLINVMMMMVMEMTQSWKMSNLLHGPISTNQILPGEKRVNRDIFGTLNLQNRTYGPGFLVMNKLSINGSLSIDLIFFAHIFPKMACFC